MQEFTTKVHRDRDHGTTGPSRSLGPVLSRPVSGPSRDFPGRDSPVAITNTYTQMCFDRNINGNRDVKFLVGIIGHCTDELMKETYFKLLKIRDLAFVCPYFMCWSMHYFSELSCPPNFHQFCMTKGSN